MTLFVGFIFGAAAYLLWKQHKEILRLRAEIERKNAVILETFERENKANARAARFHTQAVMSTPQLAQWKPFTTIHPN